MTPRLPPELLAEIVALAQVGELPRERQRLRVAFRSVCRDWYFADDFWSEVCLHGALNARKLARVLSARREAVDEAGSPGVGGRVKSAYIGLLDKDKAQEGLDMSIALRCMSQLERVEVEVWNGALSLHASIDPVLVQVLSTVRNVKLFKMARLTSRAYTRQSVPLQNVHPSVSFG